MREIFHAKFAIGHTSVNRNFIKVRVVDSVEVMFGWQWEGRVIERFCEFTVDGREGWGVSEWHFNHKEGGKESTASFSKLMFISKIFCIFSYKMI